MAIRLSGTTILMTRGDTLRLKVTIYQDDAIYEPQDKDTVRFAMRPAALNVSKTAFRNDVVVMKDIPIDTLVLELEPSDTKKLQFGTYMYDIQLTMADGTVDTFIHEATLKLLPEVE